MRTSKYVSVLAPASVITSWLLRDNFTTDRAAGAVNGTAAEPGPGVRTVTDTESKLSVSGDVLSLSGGKASPAWGDPGIWWAVQTRAAGLALMLDATIADVTNSVEFGFDTNQAGNIGSNGLRVASDLLYPLSGGSVGPALLTPADATAYKFAVVLRATGAFWYVKGGAYTYWTLIWIGATDSTASLYPGLANYNAASSDDNMRVARLNWLPAPLTSDGFGSTFGTSDGLGHAETSGIGSGGEGRTWTGATWANSGGKASNTPTQGGELVTNGTFDSDLAGWTDESSVGGAIAWSAGTIEITYTTGIPRARQEVAAVLGSWYALSVAQVSGSGLDTRVGTAAGNTGYIYSSNGSVLKVIRAVGATLYLQVSKLGAGAVYADNVSVLPLTLSTLFASTTHSTSDVLVTAVLTLTAGTQAGVVLNLDSASSPANFVIAYHDGTNCKLEKCVAGTYTTVITAAATYSAGAEIRVIKDGTAYRLYYNNALVGTGTISDAGIVDNTLHGLFSTYASNTIDNFTVYARGTNGEYNAVLNEVANG